MSFTALSVITAAYRKLNKLSPGETLNADDASSGFDELNMLVDELSSKNQFLFKSVLTSAAQTGNITLGTGSWSAIASGTEIVSGTTTVEVGGTTDTPLSPLTMAQYNAIGNPADTGAPSHYAHDGLSTVYLYPVATGQTIKLQTRISVTAFADQTTSYTVPPGYKSGLSAALAVRLAPSILGRIPSELLRAETQAMSGINNYKPAIVDVHSYT